MIATKILLADDHKIVREGLKKILEDEPGFKVIGEASSGDEAVSLVGELKPDVVVLDVVMPPSNGVEDHDKHHRKGK